MVNTLAGCTFIRNGIEFDYSFVEAIKCLQEFCDHVFVVDAGSDDGTVDELKKLENETTTIIYLTKQEWLAQHGKEKLSYFSNIAIKAAEDAGYNYQFYLQGDEILHQKSYPEVTKAIAVGQDGYMCNRINLWHSCYEQLDVPLERMPCSKSVIRLTKTKFRCVGDAENLEVPIVETYFESGIDIWHYGFVRRKEIMKAKIINMQQGVFAMSDYDKKLDQCDIFDSTLWFDPYRDLKPIDYPHPKIMKEWIKTRP